MAIKLSGSTIIDDSRNIIDAGIVTATRFTGDGSSLTGIVTSIAAGSGIAIDRTNGAVTITATGGVPGDGGSGIALTSFSVATGVATVGGSLSYNNTNGVFTFNPALGGGGGGSSLTVKEVAGRFGATNLSVSNVTELRFNNAAGFNVEDETGGVAFIDLGSTFNPWYVYGQDTLKADGEEPIEFVAGPGIAITTKAVSSVGIGTTLSKAITIGISNNLNFSGIVTASSFVKSGGTSSQFLKADGTVDSSTYLTSYTETDTLNSVTGRGNSTSNGISVGVLTATSFVKSGGTSSQFLKADGTVDSSTYLTSLGSIDGHSDVDTVSTSPTNGQALVWDGTNWKPGDIVASAAPTAVDYGTAFPTTGVAEGDLFYNTNYGKIFVRYDGYWVDASPNLAAKPNFGAVDSHMLPITDNTYDLGSFSYRWRNIYTTDLNLSNEGKQNDVDGTWGKWTIQEGEEDLFIINRRNGKKYKFILQEVD